MADMKLVVVGAAGRMGRTLVRVIAATEGVTLHAAIERPDANEIGTDAGTLAGLPPLGVPVTDDPLAAMGAKSQVPKEIEPTYRELCSKYGAGKSTFELTIDKSESNLELKFD